MRERRNHGTPIGLAAWHNALHGLSLRRRLAAVGALLLVTQSLGCATTACQEGQHWVNEQLESRSETLVSPSLAPGECTIPPGVDLSDGLTEDEAVAVALSNNAAFLATLTDLGISHGDLVTAGQLSNPQLMAILPVGAKQFEWTIYAPLDALLIRPKRVALAARDYHRVGQQLVANGLNVIRDVRVAYADLELAANRAELAEETVEVRARMASLAMRRVEAGDVSELEATSALIASLEAQAQAALVSQDIALAQNRLRALLGVDLPAEYVILSEVLDLPDHRNDTEGLVDTAMALRPDLRAAEFAVGAATQRAELARWQFFRVEVGADGNSKGPKGGDGGPAIRLDVPIFNRNEGGIARAESEVEQALRRRLAVHDQIVLEVTNAQTQLEQASQSLDVLEQQVLPVMQDAVELAERAFEGGDTSYLLVLEATNRFLGARAMELEQLAAYRRAWAELERSVGCRLDAGIVDVNEFELPHEVIAP